MNDKELAKAIVALMDAHEASWDGNTFTVGHWYFDSVELLLKTVESAFSLTLQRFGRRWGDDVYALCVEVAADKLSAD